MGELVKDDIAGANMAVDGKDVIRKRILKAALDISDKVDYDSVTMREVSRLADVSLASIYVHFPSKEQLLVAIADDKLRGLVVDLKNHDDHVTGTLNRLKVFTWNYLRFHETNPKISWVIYMSTNVLNWFGNPELWKDTNELGRILRNILTEGQAGGEVRKDINMRFVSHQYFGGLRFVVVDWLLGDRKWSLTSDMDSFAEITYCSVSVADSEFLHSRCPFMSGSNAQGV